MTRSAVGLEQDQNALAVACCCFASFVVYCLCLLLLSYSEYFHSGSGAGFYSVPPTGFDPGGVVIHGPLSVALGWPSSRHCYQDNATTQHFHNLISHEPHNNNVNFCI